MEKSLDDVSKTCKKSLHCKSKITASGNNFTVETVRDDPDCRANDPRTVWMKRSTDADKLRNLDELMSESGFFAVVEEKCNKIGKESCKIKVKPNISAATQVSYKYYTDPALVDHVVGRLKERGYTNVEIVESATGFSMAFPSHIPDKIAVKIGYKNPVVNLSRDEIVTVRYKKGSTGISKRMVEADVIIDMPKLKNHQLQYFTGALKNMYGSLPVVDKYAAYHHEKSGLNVEDVTVLVNHATPVDFVIGDMIHGIDGNEEPVKAIPTGEFFEANLLMASRDPFYLDKVVEAKTGHEENESPILKATATFRGDTSTDDIPIKGGDLSKIKGWKRVAPSHRRNVLARDDFSRGLRDIGLDSLITDGMKIWNYDVH
jgi:uncharacterized protein (DUF362 family)